MPKRHIEEENTESVKKTKVEKNEEKEWHVLEIPDVICHIAQFMTIEKPTEYLRISQSWLKTLPKTNFTLNSIMSEIEHVQKTVNYCQLFPNMRHNIYIRNLTTGSFSKHLKKIFADAIILSDGAIDLDDVQHLASRLTKLRINTSTIFNLKKIQSFQQLKVIDLISCIDRSNRCFTDLSLINTNYLTHFSVSELMISDFSFVKDNKSFNNVDVIVLGRSLAKKVLFPDDISQNLANLKRMVLYFEHPLPTDTSNMKCLKRLEIQFQEDNYNNDWSRKLASYGVEHGIEIHAIIVDGFKDK